MNFFNGLTTWQRAFCATGIISLVPNVILFGIPSSILTSKTKKGAINYQHIMLCFAAGGLLGDVLLHTIPHLLIHHDHHHDKATKHTKHVTETHDAVETLLYGIDDHHHDHHQHHDHDHESVHANHYHVLLVGILILAGFLVFFLVEKFAAMRMTHVATGQAKKDDTISSKNRSTAVKAKVNATSISETNNSTKKRTIKTRASVAAENTGDHDDIEVEEDDDSQLHHRHHHHHATIWESLTASGWLNLLADSMHNFTDGIALGASFSSTASKGLGTAALLSVLFHEIPHELSDFTILVESGLSKWQAIQAQFLTALAAFIGIQHALSH